MKDNINMSTGTGRHQAQLSNYLKSHKNGGSTPPRTNSPAKGTNRTPLAHSPARKSASNESQMSPLTPGQRSPVTSGPRSRVASGLKSSSVKPRNSPVKSPAAKTPMPRGVKVYYRKPTMDSMPEELLLKVFQYMSASELMTASCVCKQWLKLTSDNLIWEQLFIHQTAKVKGDDKGQRLGTPLKGPPETRWKRQCIDWCKRRRNSKMTALLKKINPYTLMPANTEKALQKLCIRWQVVLTDRNKTEHTFLHSDVFCYPTTTTIRWYSLEPPPIKSLTRITIHGLSPLFINKDGKAEPNSACQRSLLLDATLNVSQHAIIGCDDLVNLHVIGQGLLLATWKVGGEIAFISYCVHNHKLLQRCCLGSSNKEYIAPSLKPSFDDVDAQYGLHHFTCVMELRNQRTVLWGQQFNNLHCDKEQIGDGFVHLVPIRPDVVTDHSYTTKKLTLPWKTDLFKGIVQNFCILDLTLLDEFKSPMWLCSRPVKVTPADGDKVTYNYEGEPYIIEFEDDKGRVTVDLVTDEDRFAVTGIMVDVDVKTINDWFSTKY